MEMHDLKRFSRILVLIFLGLFAGSYTAGLIPDGAKEMVWSFLRPDGPATYASGFTSGDVSLDSVKIPPIQNVPVKNVKVPVVNAADRWTAPRIVSAKISLDAAILFPKTKNLDVLNANLMKGVVHWPDSAMPGQTGNVLIFGHSTTLPARWTPIYKVFNHLKELKYGDVIEIHSDTRVYNYRVLGVETKQADDARIDLTSNKKLLTLSTCNILGGHEARYVVTAEFVESHPLGQ